MSYKEKMMIRAPAIMCIGMVLFCVSPAFSQSANVSTNPPAYGTGNNGLSQTPSGGLRSQPQDGAGHDVSAAHPLPVSASVGPSSRTIVPLDISTVTTGGTAVTALNAGHRSSGGFLYNPIGASINLCINEQGVASGTTSAGALTCIQPGQAYTLAPAAGAVSVITSDSSHPFSGYGLN